MNNLKKCKHCQTEIDSNAKVCPNCRKKQGFPTWAIIVIIVAVIIGVASSSSNSEGSSSSNDNNKQSEKFTYTVTNEYTDMFAHYIEGTVKNNRDKDYSYLQIEFICYDPDGNNLGTAMDNTNNLLGNQTWKFKAMGLFTDKTVDHCDYHEITGW